MSGPDGNLLLKPLLVAVLLLFSQPALSVILHDADNPFHLAVERLQRKHPHMKESLLPGGTGQSRIIFHITQPAAGSEQGLIKGGGQPYGPGLFILKNIVAIN